MKRSRISLLSAIFAGLLGTLPFTAQAADPSPVPMPVPSFEELQNLVIRDLVIGKGATAEAGQTVVVHYTGWLYDPKQPDLRGKEFDSSVGRDSPFTFPLGANRVIKGWDRGVAGMKVGGKRTLIIPGYLAYGERGAGNGVIPRDAILVFDIELLKIK